MTVAFGDIVVSGFYLNSDKMALCYVSQNIPSHAFLSSFLPKIYLYVFTCMYVCMYDVCRYVRMYVHTMQYLRSPEEGVRFPDDPELPLGAGN